jgi:hypothetical protein
MVSLHKSNAHRGCQEGQRDSGCDVCFGHNDIPGKPSKKKKKPFLPFKTVPNNDLTEMTSDLGNDVTLMSVRVAQTRHVPKVGVDFESRTCGGISFGPRRGEGTFGFLTGNGHQSIKRARAPSLPPIPFLQ